MWVAPSAPTLEKIRFFLLGRGLSKNVCAELREIGFVSSFRLIPGKFMFGITQKLSGYERVSSFKFQV